MNGVPLPVLVSLASLFVGLAGVCIAVVKLYGVKVQEAEDRGKLLAKVDRLTEDVAALMADTKTMWQFMVRRGQVEAMRKGWGEYSSPFQINGVAFEVVLPFLTTFLPWYATTLAARPDISDGELSAKLEAKFGEFIVEKICIPQGVTEGACMVAIIEVCRHEYEKKGAL